MLRVSVALISLDAGHIGVQHLDVLDVVFGNVEDVADVYKRQIHFWNAPVEMRFASQKSLILIR